MCDFYICLKAMTNHTAWEWFADIIIPATGAIAIPVLIWWFGAEKAEERKNLKELTNNLNLLLSLCVDGIERLKSLREVFIKIHNIEEEAKGCHIESFAYSQAASILWKKHSFPMDLSIINVANYSPCIEYSSDFVIKLSKIISAFKIIVFIIENRNSYVEKISNQPPLEKAAYLESIINMDLQDHKDFIYRIDESMLFIKDFIVQIESLKDKIKGLNLKNIPLKKEILDLLSQLEKEKVKQNDK